jgi:DNA-binding GntR family transcriptional regulator
MIKRETLNQKVYDRLLRMIVAGEMAPGDPLREADLAERLGVSRTPVREALNRMAEHHLVEMRPHRGAVVRHLRREEVIHLHQVREALEGLAAQLACGRLTAADFERLDALAKASEDEDSPGYFRAFDKFDVELHRLVAQRSGNPILAREIRKLLETMMLIHAQLELVLLGYHQISAVDRKRIRKECWHQHIAVVAALKAGNPQASRRAMIGHVQSSCEFKLRLLEGLEEAGVRGSPAPSRNSRRIASPLPLPR